MYTIPLDEWLNHAPKTTASKSSFVYHVHHPFFCENIIALFGEKTEHLGVK